MQPHVSDVDAVNKDGTPSRLHQSEQRQSQGRFACPCPAHNAHLVTSDKKPTSKSVLPFLFPLRPSNPHTAPLLCIYRYSTNTAPLLCIYRYSTNTALHLSSVSIGTVQTAPLLCSYRYSKNTAPLLSSVSIGTVQTQRLSSVSIGTVQTQRLSSVSIGTVQTQRLSHIYIYIYPRLCI